MLWVQRRYGDPACSGVLPSTTVQTNDSQLRSKCGVLPFAWRCFLALELESANSRAALCAEARASAMRVVKKTTG